MKGEGMFSGEHFIWIGLCAVFVAGMSWLSVTRGWSTKRAGMVMTAICVVSEASKMLTHMVPSAAGGMHLDPLALPFHLCSQMIFLVPFIAFAQDSPVKKRAINFYSVLGVLGGFCAIMIPTDGTSFLSADSYQCFVFHAGMVWYAIHLIATGAASLNVRSMFETMGIMLGVAFMVMYVNGALAAYDTNFLFLTRPPLEGLPYLNLNAGWYVYFVRIVALALGGIALFHLPFILKGRKQKA